MSMHCIKSLWFSSSFPLLACPYSPALSLVTWRQWSIRYVRGVSTGTRAHHRCSVSCNDSSQKLDSGNFLLHESLEPTHVLREQKKDILLLFKSELKSRLRLPPYPNLRLIIISFSINVLSR